MNDFSIFYLANRFVFRVSDFFRHWYVDGSRFFLVQFLNYVRTLDKTLALKVTFRHLFEPLYKDYTIVGTFLGPVFRIGRVLFGTLLYALIAIVAVILYAVWIFAPAIILIYAIKP